MQVNMGHDDIRTTQRYAKVTNLVAREEMVRVQSVRRSRELRQNYGAAVSETL